MDRESGSNALESTWPGSSGKVKEKWNRLTDNDVRSIDGQSDHLVSRLQERYGYTRERAERECQHFIDELEASSARQSERASSSSSIAGASRQASAGGRETGS